MRYLVSRSLAGIALNTAGTLARGTAENDVALAGKRGPKERFVGVSWYALLDAIARAFFGTAPPRALGGGKTPG